MMRTADGTLVFFVGEYYEYSVNGAETHERKYYGREAMHLDGIPHHPSPPLPKTWERREQIAGGNKLN